MKVSSYQSEVSVSPQSRSPKANRMMMVRAKGVAREDHVATDWRAAPGRPVLVMCLLYLSLTYPKAWNTI